MHQVTSMDGTSITYERLGNGPAVIVIGGGLDDGSENAPLAAALAEHFTVYNYARRGRAKSGDTLPYAIDREFEDIATLITVAGGSAHLYGVSTGGALALEAVAAGVEAETVGVYEVPYNMADDWPATWNAYVQQLGSLLADGRRGDALELFMRLTNATDNDITAVRSSPYWPGMEALAHTLAYDAACLGDGQPPIERLAKITQPTLVATGVSGREPGAPAWIAALDQAADTIVASVAEGHRVTAEGQTHVADPKVVAPILRDFFTR